MGEDLLPSEDKPKEDQEQQQELLRSLLKNEGIEASRLQEWTNAQLLEKTINKALARLRNFKRLQERANTQLPEETIDYARAFDFWINSI